MMRSLSGKRLELITILEKPSTKRGHPRRVAFSSIRRKFSVCLRRAFRSRGASCTKKISCCLERRLQRHERGQCALIPSSCTTAGARAMSANHLKVRVRLQLFKPVPRVLSGARRETLPTDAEKTTSSSTRLTSRSILRILKRIFRRRCRPIRANSTGSDKHGFLSDYYHMMGPSHIRRWVFAGRAIHSHAHRARRDSDGEQCRNNMIKAYRQLICIYIDRYETKQMHEVVEKAFAV